MKRYLIALACIALIVIFGQVTPVAASTDLASLNLANAERFLASKEKEEGVIKTESGLLYKVIRKGDSKIYPKASDTVKVHYKGTLADGTVFDSSYDRGQPISFGLHQVIRGWTEALQLMNVGSHHQVYIKPSLGYGARGAGRAIGPNSALVFDIELLDVVGKKDEL